MCCRFLVVWHYCRLMLSIVALMYFFSLLRSLLAAFQFGVVHQVVYIGTLRHGNLSLSRLGFLQVVEECLCLGAGGEAYREY